MRILTGILFTIGIYFAIFAWIGIWASFSLFQSNHGFELSEAILILMWGITSFVGYYVWINWGYFTFRAKFILVSWRKFWLVSFIQHTAWLFIFPQLAGQSIFEYLIDAETFWWNLWILGNIIVSLTCVFRPPFPAIRREEPVGSLNSESLRSSP